MTALRIASAPTRLALAIGVTAALVAGGLVGAGPASAAFGLSSFTNVYQDASGAPATQAGSHADVVTDLAFNLTTGPDGTEIPDEELRDLQVDLPAGFYGNPKAQPTCTASQLVARDGYCEPAAQVGVLDYEIIPGFNLEFPVYNMQTPATKTAVLGAIVVGAQVNINVSVRTEGDYGLRATLSNINQALILRRTVLTLWGVPADPVHDPARYSALFTGGLSAGVPPKPFLTLPARCEPATTSLKADSWQHPGTWVTASATSPPLTGCDRLQFDAKLSARPQVTDAGAPSGYDASLSIPQDLSTNGLGTPQLRKAVVTLPEGTTVSAASAAGLGACSDENLKLGTSEEPTCPESSKVGTVSITTPVLDDPVQGDVILGTQRPDQLLRLFVVARGPGLLLKIPGKVDLDPVTGRLVATFDGTPQLPFSRLDTSFKGGPRAALSNPKACGTYTTHATLTPWSGGPAVETDDSFTIDQRCDRAGRFEPTLDAGVVNPTAGGSSTFVLNLSRPDGQQDINGLEVTLPPGLLAHVDDVPLCPEAQAAAGTCAAASQIGSVRAGAGAGPSPLSVPEPGKAPTAVYLAGPYKGAPFSLSIVVPAQAGPFDLGTVVVREALFVDPTTAQVLVRSDPLPTILQGVPLDLQKLSVTIDRPRFMLTPTNCAPMQISARVSSTSGANVEVSSPFQATDCASLAHRPKLAFALTGKGQTTDAKHPTLVAHLTPRAGDANIKQTKVTLPLSLALDPNNANGLCEPSDAAADRCPAASIVGHAKAVSLLHEPLDGPIYFVRGERKDPKSGRVIRTLPKLYLPLRGEGVQINVYASSEVPDGKHLVTTFDNLPDVLLKSFDLTVNGGAHGILVVSNANLCAANQIATGDFVGQNGKAFEDDISMATPCPLSIKGAGHGPSTVKLTVGGLTAGKVRVSGAGIQATTRTISTATVATVMPKLRAAAVRALVAGRVVTLRVNVAFTPNGAKKAKKITKTITLHG
jgi:hypothetical protein